MSSSVNIQSRHTSIPAGGTNRSKVLQEFIDRTVEDVHAVGEAIDQNTANIADVGSNVLQEMRFLKTQVNALALKEDFRERNAENMVYNVDLFNRKDFFYAEGTDPSKRLVLDQKHGQVYLPPTSVAPLFFSEDPLTGTLTEISSLDVRVNSISEFSSAGYQPTVSEGDISNAFNGNNSSFWVRKVEYPYEAPVSEVIVDVEVVVPSVSPGEFNVFEIDPHPLGRCDIVGVWYKERAESATWTLLEEFPSEYDGTTGGRTALPINEAISQRFAGQVRPVHSFKIRLRQRDWIIENNKKVFYYGAQEIQASLVRYTNVSSIDPLDTPSNAHIVHKVKSPELTDFGSITKIKIEPNPKSEGTSIDDNHLLVLLSTTPTPTNFGSDIIWRSNASSLPQNGTAIALDGVSEYYIIISMKYVADITKESSVFDIDTSPILNSIYIVHTLNQLEGTAEEDDFVVDWGPRNATSHFQNLMMMDSYRNALDDGSQLSVLWDDFWEDATFRTALEDTGDGVVIDESRMSLTTESDLPFSPSAPANYLSYLALTDANWGAMEPKRIKLQTAIENTGGSEVSFLVKYEINGAPQSDQVISHATLVSTLGSVDWITLPGADPNDPGFIGEVTSLQIEVVLKNGSNSGDRPYLHQFAFILKD